MAKIQAFNGIIVFDHNKKRFWSAKEIISLAKEFWKDAEMPSNPSVSDLAWIFREEFDVYTDIENKDIIGYWDDAGTWEILEAPQNIGFGIIEENSNKRIIELNKEVSSVSSQD